MRGTVLLVRRAHAAHTGWRGTLRAAGARRSLTCSAVRAAAAAPAAAGAEPRHVTDQSWLALAAAAAATAAAVAAAGGAQFGGAARCEAVASLRPQSFRSLSVVRTTKDGGERLAELPSVALGADDSGGAQAPSVFVCTAASAQTDKPFLGFGGSFTESAANALNRLPAERREEAMRAYFDKQRGLGFSIGRVQIGSCDFSVSSWTCGDLQEGDKELKGFSIDQYEKLGILPMIQQAAALAGGPLTLLASPWSPPPYMKTKRQYHGDGHLLPAWRETWALHFVKFVQAMQAKGVPIWGVSVQNEPEAAQIWESCIYSAEEETVFIKDHLGPALARNHLSDVKILFWDHNRDGMFERAAKTYADPEAAKYIWGICFHWYGDPRYESWPPRAEVPYKDRQRGERPIFELKACAGFDNVRRVADLRPDKHILFSEGCQELGGRPLAQLLGDWKLGERYAMNIVSDLNSGCEGFIDWNLFLDEEGGPNHVGNLCSAPVICDSKSGKPLYQPSFWYLGHFSRYIRPGAKRVLSSTSRDALEVTSYLNEDGRLAVVVMNQSEENIDFWLKIAGEGPGSVVAAKVQAPARSIATFVAHDGSAAEPFWRRWLPRSWWQKHEPWQAVQ